jgi:hypothetical protein
VESHLEMGINPLHFAHDPVVFLDLFLGNPDNVADCSSLPPQEEDRTKTYLPPI